ncbi:PQQ-like beta-propeller repeat protein [Phenylobacterium montanum]|uniref:PQQ-binding-like beta-propeller repeat protein n=1 Tax=Phenylobacterium montanum TaxID=2823693 RepID=A0A975IVR5_9CAUL|nr:PQQ-like beta-propeller repeat protein [Caulobacter sp. S6]QUD88829.1 PQQ-binding-like beta-propeller repeat protein [Caulobacter sp. S6]
MKIDHRFGLVALLAAGVALSGCSHFHNPFAGGGSKSKYHGKGERIPIIAFDQSLKISDTLKGQDFYLPPPAAQQAWPEPGGVVDQAIENVDAGKDFAVAWKAKIGAGSERKTYITAPPVAADGKIFVMDGAARVSAYDAASGREVWRADMARRGKRNKEGFGGGLAYADGRVFVSSGYRFVAAVDAASGKEIWRQETEAPVHAAPTVSGGRVIVESVDDNLLTFDAATGATGWTYQALSEPARILAATSPAVSGDAVVASFASGELVALQAANGTGLWSLVLSKSNRNSALSEIRDIPGRPVIYRGDVFAVSHSGVFTDVELRTGAQRWELPVTSVSTPWPAGDVVYVTDTAGEVICASRDSGQIYWIADMNKGAKKKKDRGLWSGPILANNRVVVVSTTGEAVALNAKTGAAERRLKIGSPALLNPIAVGGNLYVVSQAAELIAIR